MKYPERLHTSYVQEKKFKLLLNMKSGHRDQEHKSGLVRRAY